jgi:hypothetical protein
MGNSAGHWPVNLACGAVARPGVPSFHPRPLEAAPADGTQNDLDRDLGVYLELARNYQKRKQWQRTWPAAVA